MIAYAQSGMLMHLWTISLSLVRTLLRDLSITVWDSLTHDPQTVVLQTFLRVAGEWGGAGIDAFPGLARAATVSTALARRLSENEVMQTADWASAHTMYANYFRFLTPEVVQSSVSGGLVQNALLTSD